MLHLIGVEAGVSWRACAHVLHMHTQVVHMSTRSCISVPASAVLVQIQRSCCCCCAIATHSGQSKPVWRFKFEVADTALVSRARLLLKSGFILSTDCKLCCAYACTWQCLLWRRPVCLHRCSVQGTAVQELRYSCCSCIAVLLDCNTIYKLMDAWR